LISEIIIESARWSNRTKIGHVPNGEIGIYKILTRKFSMQKLFRGAIVTACLMAGSQAAVADVTVTGSFVKFGVNNGGSLIDHTTQTGIQYDPTGTGNFNSAADMLTPGTPFAFYSLGVNGDYGTAGAGSGANPFSSVTGNFAAGNNTFTITSGGTYQGLAVSQVISFDLTSSVIHTNVVLTNISGATLNNVSYAVGLDPDQDAVDYNYSTTNTILGQGADAAVQAAGTSYALTLRNTSGWDATASISPDWSINPYVLSGASGANGYGDSTISLGYGLGALGAGEQFSIGYDYVLTPTAPVPEPTTWLMMLAGLGLLGAAARRRRG
jgi:hypothetical protein